MKQPSIIKAPWSRESSARYDQKEIYIPLRDILREVKARLREFDLFVPIAKIAWMLIKGRFSEERHREIKEDLYDYLRVGNDYRKRYFELKTDASSYFDRLMKKRGWYYPEAKEYCFIRNEVHMPLIREDKRQEWLDAFGTRMELLGRARAGGEATPDGEEVLSKLEKRFSRRIKALKRSRRTFSERTDVMLRYVEAAIKNPSTPWSRIKEMVDGGEVSP